MKFYYLTILIMFAFYNAKSQCNQTFDLGSDIEICIGTSTTLDAGSGYLTYLWNDNSTNQTLTVGTPGQYFCTVTALDESIELIANGDFEQGNTLFTSDYFYLAIDLVTGPNAVYGVIDNPNTWFAPFFPCTDNTSGTGEMMVLDGAVANASNTSFWCQTVNINTNTDYNFSYWVQNLTSAPYANIRVEINGVILGSELCPSAPCTWQETEYVWNSGVNTTADICMFNMESSGNGNDFAIDDISLNPFCVKRDTILVSQALQDTIFETEVLCDGDSFLVDGIYEFISGFYYENTIVNNCNVVKQIELIFNPIPIVDAGQDTTIITGEEAILNAESDLTGTSFQWFLDNVLVSSDSSFVYSVSETSNFSVIAEKDGCVGSDEVTVFTVDSDNDLLFPTAFSPNNDGTNDLFRLINTDNVESIELSIYNRWGERIHNGFNEDHPWNGKYKNKDQAFDIYIFFVKIIFFGGKVSNESGTFSLVR